MNDIIGLENGMESCGNHKIVIDRYLISFFLIQENWMISQIISRVKYAYSILIMIFVFCVCLAGYIDKLGLRLVANKF